MSHNLVNLGAAELDPATKALRVQCKGEPVDEDGTAPDYGMAAAFCALGLTVKPWPADKNGSAEGIAATDVPGMDGALVGARDVRCANVVGNLKDGDVCLHSVGPQHKAQIQLKETKRQVAVLSEDSDGETQMILLDGTANKYTVAVSGAVIEIDKKGVASIIAADGSGLVVGNGGVRILGKLTVGNPQPGFTIMMGPQIGSPGAIATPPMFPCLGFSVG